MDCEQEVDAKATLRVRGKGQFRLASLRNFFRCADEGGSLVEFALVAPMMMMLMTGMFSFGIGLNNYIILTNAVNAGARSMALARNQTTPALAGTDPCKYATQVLSNSAPLINTSGLTFAISYSTTSTSTVTTTNYTNTCAGLTMNPGDTVQMQATLPYSLAIYGWKATSINLVGQTSEFVQ
jgi:Flp pilus assembly protein TadG